MSGLDTSTIKYDNNMGSDVSNALDEIKKEKQSAAASLRKELTPDIIKELKGVINNPDIWAGLNSKVKSKINNIKSLVPDLFLTAQEKYLQHTGGPTITPLQQKQSTSLDVINKLGLTGILKNTGQALITAGEKGYLPELKDMNVFGAMKQAVTFPLDKILQGLGTLGRLPSAIQQQVQTKGLASGEYPAKISDFNLQNYDVLAQAKKNINPLNTIKALSSIGGEGWKEVGKAAVEPIYDMKSKYRGFGFDQPNTEMLGGTEINKTPMESMQPFLEKWKNGTPIQQAYYKFVNTLSPDEKGNWWQRLISGFAGTPLDVISLGEDVTFDLTTYAGGGLIKGASTGIKLTEEGASGAIGKILKVGSEIGLMPETRTAFNVAKDVRWGKLFNGIKDGSILPSAVKGITGTDEVAKVLALKVIEDRALNKFLSEIPDIQSAYKAIDLGGTKFMGTTVIPGYKYAEAGKKFEKTKFGKRWQQLFNAQEGIPQSFRNIASYAQTSSEADKMALQNKFAILLKQNKVNEKDLSIVQDYFGIQSDIEKANNELTKVTSGIQDLSKGGVQPDLFGQTDKLDVLTNAKTRLDELITKYTGKVEELTPKQLATVEDLKTFADEVYQQRIAAGGDPNIGKYEWYAPDRYIDKNAQQIATKKSLTGSIEQPFMKEKVISTAQAKELGLQNKDIVTSWNQRLWEQEKDLFRTRLVNGSREFTSNTAKEGYVAIENIPELKGLYMPQEYADMFKKTYGTFFGDKSFKTLMKAYDSTLTLWKKLALFTPGYDARNFITDTVSGFMHWGVKDWLNPKNWNDMRNIMQKNHVPIKWFGGEVEYADDIAKKLLTTRLMDTAQSITEKGATGLKKGFSLFDWKFSKISNPRENMGRVLGYVIERKAGASDLMASAISKGVFFDYIHSLTPFEKNIAKRFINPFWSWQKNNTRRQFELLFTRTGQYATIPKAMNFVRNISDVPEDYDEFKQDYKKKIAMIPTPFKNPGRMDWWSNLTGQAKTTQAGDMLEYSPNQAFQDWSKLSPTDLGSSLSPLLKVGLELGFNKNMFLDKPIYSSKSVGYVPPVEANLLLQKTLGKAPEGLLKLLGITKREEDGKLLIPPAENYILQTLLPQYALSQRGFVGTDNAVWAIFSALFGSKFTPNNMEKNKEQYTTNWLKDANIKQNEYESAKGKDYQLPSTTQIESAYKEAYKNTISEKYAEVLQLKELLDTVGSNKETDAYVAELLKPYNEELDKVKNASLIDIKKLLKDLNIELSLTDIEAIIAARQSD